jgi:hypothetical protein
MDDAGCLIVLIIAFAVGAFGWKVAPGIWAELERPSCGCAVPATGGALNK